MCNLYSLTRGPKAIRDIANAMGGDWLDNAGNLQPQAGIFPDGVAPVVRVTPSGARELLKMRWGLGQALWSLVDPHRKLRPSPLRE